MRVIDARSRNLPGFAGSAAAARVLVESGDERDVWGTAGVSENLLEGICRALCDAIEYKLVKDEVAPRMRKRRG
jgi:2-isopropylmalate synthase